MSRPSLPRRIFQRIRKILRILAWHSVFKLKKHATVRTKQGVFTLLTADNYVAKSLYCFEQHEMDWMETAFSFLRKEGHIPAEGHGTVIDIGANNGCSSVAMLLVNKVARSVAIEPDPRNFSLLERNIRQNNLQDRAVCLPYALSAEPGEMQLELSPVNSGDHRIRVAGSPAVEDRHAESARQVIAVKTARLDDLVQGLPEAFARDVSLVWIDVQGHEGYVFRGAEKFLSRGVPTVAEFWPYGIRRAGMSEAEFTGIVRAIWPHYWLPRGPKGAEEFVRYPTSSLPELFAEIGYNDSKKNNRGCNLIFTA